MTWKLYLDDVRKPDEEDYYIARTSREARWLVEDLGMPTFMSLDHDLGINDTSMIFLHWLVSEYYEPGDPVPEYKVHSANPVGAENIKSFMETWKKFSKLNKEA